MDERPTSLDSDIVLPDLQDQDLDWETVDQLFTDLELAAKIEGIKLRPLGQREAEQGSVNLESAAQALKAGRAAVQITYHYQSQRWIDTLMPVSGGARLIRTSMAHLSNS